MTFFTIDLYIPLKGTVDRYQLFKYNTKTDELHI